MLNGIYGCGYPLACESGIKSSAECSEKFTENMSAWVKNGPSSKLVHTCYFAIIEIAGNIVTSSSVRGNCRVYIK